jgi:hypothetical protein
MFGKKKASAETAPVETVTPVAAAPSSTGISPEIIAVITAAIAAMTSGGAVSSNGFIVRKISRIHGESVTWNNAGLMECIDSRKM